MSELRSRYFRTLGIAAEGAETAKLRQSAFTRACERRDFEIEHYWKRATYFWAFEVAIFAAFGFLWGKSDTGASPITIFLAGLGILTAFTNKLAALGSRFWQENWENYIDMLEDEFEGRLYKTVWLDEGKVSYSVSRVNLSLKAHYSSVPCQTKHRQAERAAWMRNHRVRAKLDPLVDALEGAPHAASETEAAAAIREAIGEVTDGLSNAATAADTVAGVARRGGHPDGK